MKRRTAIFLSGTLLLSIGGYVALCWRSFYVTPPLSLEGSMSLGGRRAVEEWAQVAGYPRPLGFTWSSALWNLSHPWDCKTVSPTWAREDPGGGLWVTDGSRVWSFSKVRGKWDASTAADHGAGGEWLIQGLRHWGRIATGLETMEASGAVIEVVSLGAATKSWTAPSSGKPESFRDSAGELYGYEVMGRTRVLVDQERWELVEALARSIREGKNAGSLHAPTGFPTSPAHAPPHAIIFTRGGERMEFLLWFDLGGGLVFGEGADEPFARDEASFSRFCVSPHAASAFDDFLDMHQIERLPRLRKP